VLLVFCPPSGLAHIPFVTHGLRRGLHILGAAPRLKSSKGPPAILSVTL